MDDAEARTVPLPSPFISDDGQLEGHFPALPWSLAQKKRKMKAIINMLMLFITIQNIGFS